MKRSEINRYLEEAKAFFKEFKFELPVWAFWRPEQWLEQEDACAEIRDLALGWDITDFGSGDFEKIGLLLFTLRNGDIKNPAYKKSYAEKIMMVRTDQVTPIHFHWNKMEDIINRGGGDFVTQIWKADKNEQLSDEEFTVQIDGITHKVKGGDTIRLKPGQSISFAPYIYHTFYAENAPALIGEVSMVNDDANDNRFLAPMGRFPEIEEDVPPLHLLCNEYPS